MSAQPVDLPATHGQALVTSSRRWAAVKAGPELDGYTWHQADERTRTIAAKLAALRDHLGHVTDLVNDITDLLEQAWAMRADLALGYHTFEDYCADRFGDLGQVRLPIPERVQLVMALYGTGAHAGRVSKRGTARVLGVDESTVRLTIAQQAKAAPAPLAIASAPAEPTSPAAPAAAQTKTRRALAALTRAGADGLTLPEMQRRMHWTWSATTPTLSRLHAQHKVERLLEQRDGYAVYVLPEHTGARDTLPRRARRAASTRP